MEVQAKAVRTLTSAEEVARKGAADAYRVKELLVLDKVQLQQELSSSEARAEDRRRGGDAARSQVASLEAKVGQLTDQLLTLQLSARSGFDDRLDKELQRMRSESARELEGLKATSKEILDRENRVLREARASLENECTQLRDRNENLGRTVGVLQEDKASISHEKNNVISELRGELKIKCFEFTSLGVSFEQRMGQLRQTELELEVLRQEITAHRWVMCVYVCVCMCAYVCVYVCMYICCPLPASTLLRPKPPIPPLSDLRCSRWRATVPRRRAVCGQSWRQHQLVCLPTKPLRRRSTLL
jgi:hypothetical protein